MNKKEDGSLEILITNDGQPPSIIFRTVEWNLLNISFQLENGNRNMIMSGLKGIG